MSDLGLHCLPITLLRVSRLQWVNRLMHSRLFYLTLWTDSLSLTCKGEFDSVSFFFFFFLYCLQTFVRSMKIIKEGTLESDNHEAQPSASTPFFCTCSMHNAFNFTCASRENSDLPVHPRRVISGCPLKVALNHWLLTQILRRHWSDGTCTSCSDSFLDAHAIL